MNNFSKKAFCDAVSIVEPDFEPTITRASFRFAGIANLICSGSVESNTVNFLPNVFAITSGARDEPPIPQRMKLLKLFERAQALKASSWGSRSRLACGKSIQSRRTLASASAAAPHSVESLAASFAAIEFRSFATALSPSNLFITGPESSII